MKLIIPGDPIAKKRPRFRTIFTKPSKHTVTTYDSQIREKQTVKSKMCALIYGSLTNRLEVNKLLNAKYIKVSFSFKIYIPKTDSKKVRIEKIWGFQLPPVRINISNR